MPLIPIYDFSSSELEQGFFDRPAAVFKDPAVGTALAVMPDRDCFEYLRAYGRPIEGKLSSQHLNVRDTGLLNCDLYTYSLSWLLFSQRAVSRLSEMRGVSDHLIQVTIEGRSDSLFMYYAEGVNLITQNSRFGRMEAQSIPLDLLEATFIERASIKRDIFLINHPSPLFFTPTRLPQTFVTQRFKDAWEQAGLVGGQFKKIGYLPE